VAYPDDTISIAYAASSIKDSLRGSVGRVGLLTGEDELEVRSDGDLSSEGLQKFQVSKCTL
jgi:hypothetical protein